MGVSRFGEKHGKCRNRCAGTLDAVPMGEAFLAGQDADLARVAIDAIAVDLARQQSYAGSSLGMGVADCALFQAWRGETLGDTAASQRAGELLRWLVADTRSPAGGYELFRGRAGVGWAIAHLADRETADLVLQPIDTALLEVVEEQRWTGDYDLIGGLVGIGVYALERTPGAAARRLLARLLDHLAALAVPRAGGHTWHTPAEALPQWQRELAPQGYFNYGLAHGVPGIIALLAAMVEAGEHVDRARALLEPAVAWLLAGELPPERGSCFPSWDNGLSPPAATRAGWCYGDPGVAIALARAARATQSTALSDVAVRVMRRTATRDVGSAGMFDAPLCHGAFGLAHMLRSFAAFIPDDDIIRAARDWTRRGLALRREGQGLGGFQAYRPRPEAPEESPWVDDALLLTGSTGIGLVLLSMLDDDCAGWDAPLLTNL